MLEEKKENTEKNGTLLHICISAKKGICKHEITSANILADFGMEEDVHAGDWHRQISLLTHVDIESMRAKGLKLKPGAFGENLVIDGLDANELGIGSQIKVGPVLMELTQIGKVCHTRCAIYYTTGDCIMPRLGLFARVIEGGEVKSGMKVEVVRRVPREAIQAAVVTISDRCSAGTTLDTAGPAVAELLRSKLDARIAWTRVVPDEIDQIEEVLKDLSDRRVDLLFTVGGTGISSRDVTPEATRKVIDREVPGLAEAMRAASALKTPNALLSRAIAGVRRETLIINLPGSLRASTENLSVLLPVLPHAVKMLRNESAHPESDAGRLVAIESKPATQTEAHPLVEARG
jgi:molybdenum cofactor synthesis domain-containing protein